MQSITSPIPHHKTIRFISSDRPPPQTADYLQSAIRQAMKQPVKELKHELRQEIRTEIQALGQLKQPYTSRSDSGPDRDEDRYEFFRGFLLAFLGGAVIASCFAWVRYWMVTRILDEMIEEMIAETTELDVDRSRACRGKEWKRWYEMDDRKVKDFMMSSIEPTYVDIEMESGTVSSNGAPSRLSRGEKNKLIWKREQLMQKKSRDYQRARNEVLSWDSKEDIEATMPGLNDMGAQIARLRTEIEDLTAEVQSEARIEINHGGGDPRV
ncbi:hypothetical protein GE09DRAFT_1287925 [Coniochaeta sp. 2T2.1]|nr:hypothetical protein GE09DRAFT_1287925 [Coniochaeta sp. 2T2.1]